MPTKVTEIVIHFKPAPMQMFQMKEGLYKGEELIIRIQPDEGILQRIAMKEPGAGFYMGTMEMDFSYDQHDQETGMRTYACWKTVWRVILHFLPVPMPWTRAGLTLTRFWIIGRSIPKLLFMGILQEHGDRKKRMC